MERNVVRRAAGMCLVVGLTVTAYGQGVYWEAARSGGRLGDKTEIEKMYYMPKKIKSESADKGDVLILRLDKEVMTSMDSKAKTYWQMTFSEMSERMKKSSAEMDAAMADMQKEMEGMSEGERKMAEQMMKSMRPGQRSEGPKIEVTKTGDKETISGYSCTKFTVTKDGKELLSIWASKDVKEFEAMRKDFEEFQKRMAEMNPMIPEGLSEGMQKIEGFPIETDMPRGLKQVVTKIEKRSIPADEFEIPAGYTKVKAPMMRDEHEEKEQ
jgi:hypothetical protein